ncbi:sensor histidine kinase [Vreelandella venusta]|uniref:sensor histidine kinase n=1 Tax=Vreelandella venusta TaxID=44935 RepID=UPI0018DA805C|nr:HAMP domain-containing sensor histidine kinase [Halomonas venusta]QPI65582.1 HAMP domain-containing histidine kinase [Halomonas venusta]WAM57003.1 HAMP domain-containing histidine kinase [Halomonas venusta]
MSSNPVRSLAAQSRQHLLYLAIAIFIGQIALVTIFSFYQVGQAAKYYMHLDAIKLQQAANNNPDFVLPQRGDVSAYREWDDIPLEIRQLFSSSKTQPLEPLEIERVNDQGIREYGYLLYSQVQSQGRSQEPSQERSQEQSQERSQEQSQEQQAGGLYLLEFEEADKIDALAEAIFKQALIEASLVTGVFSLVLFLVISWLFKSAVKPLALLVEWSSRVKQHPGSEIDVQFSISELNQIANQLLSTLQQVREYNEREQQFLRHASHELRTPLAIIQASLDTLGVRTAPEDPNFPSLLRASRACANMILLSEALLWLARPSSRPIGKSIVWPGALCSELLVDMQYLVENKNIQVSLNDQASSINIEHDLFRIVLANLIRNAFQHTSSGTITLVITDNSLVISNPVDAAGKSETVSFGLGLQLVERIANRLDWQFEFVLDYPRACVTLRW